MKEKERTAEDEENEETRGIVVIQTEHTQPHPTVQQDSAKTWFQGGEQNRKESEGSDSQSEDPVGRQK